MYGPVQYGPCARGGYCPHDRRATARVLRLAARGRNSSFTRRPITSCPRDRHPEQRFFFLGKLPIVNWLPKWWRSQRARGEIGHNKSSTKKITPRLCCSASKRLRTSVSGSIRRPQANRRWQSKRAQQSHYPERPGAKGLVERTGRKR